MKKIYFFILVILFTSCSAKIQYVGQAASPTKQIDVYITESAVTRNYKLVGQGYLNSLANFVRKDKLQRIAEESARKNGADAIIISEFLIPTGGQTISSAYKTDSIGKAVITTGNTTISPTFSSGVRIFFLKYYP